MRHHADARLTRTVKDHSHATFVRISDLLSEAFAQLKPPEDASLELLKSEWIRVAGDLVAQHAQPVRLQNGVLHVAVSSHLWLQELKRGLGRQIQQKLNALPNIHVRTIRWYLENPQDAAKA